MRISETTLLGSRLVWALALLNMYVDIIKKVFNFSKEIMGKFIMIDDTFCYLNYEKEGIIYALKVKPIEKVLRQKIDDDRILFKDYLYSNPPWSTTHDRYKDMYEQYFERELEILNFILSIYPKADEQIIKKTEISPTCLANFLGAYCWVNGNYEIESLVLADGVIDYAIYESSNNFLFGRKRKDRIIAFRYTEFEKIKIGLVNGSPAFRLETKVCGFNGRFDRKWNSIYVH